MYGPPFTLVSAHSPRGCTAEDIREVFSGYGRLHGDGIRFGLGKKDDRFYVDFETVGAAMKALKALHNQRCPELGPTFRLVLQYDKETKLKLVTMGLLEASTLTPAIAMPERMPAGPVGSSARTAASSARSSLPFLQKKKLPMSDLHLQPSPVSRSPLPPPISSTFAAPDSVVAKLLGVAPTAASGSGNQSRLTSSATLVPRVALKRRFAKDAEQAQIERAKKQLERLQEKKVNSATPPEPTPPPVTPSFLDTLVVSPPPLPAPQAHAATEAPTIAARAKVDEQGGVGAGAWVRELRDEPFSGDEESEGGSDLSDSETSSSYSSSTATPRTKSQSKRADSRTDRTTSQASDSGASGDEEEGQASETASSRPGEGTKGASSSGSQSDYDDDGQSSASSSSFVSSRSSRSREEATKSSGSDLKLLFSSILANVDPAAASSLVEAPEEPAPGDKPHASDSREAEPNPLVATEVPGPASETTPTESGERESDSSDPQTGGFGAGRKEEGGGSVKAPLKIHVTPLIDTLKHSLAEKDVKKRKQQKSETQKRKKEAAKQEAEASEATPSSPPIPDDAVSELPPEPEESPGRDAGTATEPRRSMRRLRPGADRRKEEAAAAAASAEMADDGDHSKSDSKSPDSKTAESSSSTNQFSQSLGIRPLIPEHDAILVAQEAMAVHSGFFETRISGSFALRVAFNLSATSDQWLVQFLKQQQNLRKKGLVTGRTALEVAGSDVFIRPSVIFPALPIL